MWLLGNETSCLFFVCSLIAFWPYWNVKKVAESCPGPYYLFILISQVAYKTTQPAPVKQINRVLSNVFFSALKIFL